MTETLITTQKVFGYDEIDIDIEIINQVMENGLEFFVKSYQNLKKLLIAENKKILDIFSNEKTDILDYFKNYISLYFTHENGVWDNDLDKLNADLEKSLLEYGDDVIEMLYEFLYEVEIFSIFDKYVDKTQVIPLKVHQTITQNKRLSKIITETYSWDNPKFKDNYLGRIICNSINEVLNSKDEINYDKLNCSIDQTTMTLSELTFNLLKNKDTRDNMINWFYNILDSFKDIKKDSFTQIITVDMDSYNPPVINHNNFNDSTYLWVITKILIKLLLNGIKIDKIDYNLLDSDECLFNNSKSDDNSQEEDSDTPKKLKYNFISHSFFLVNKFIDITNVLWIKELDFRKEELEKTEELDERSSQDNGIISLYNYIFKESLQVSKNKIAFLENLLSHSEATVKKFNVNLIKWLLEFDFRSNKIKAESSESDNEEEHDKSINSFVDTMIQNYIEIMNHYKYHELSQEFIDVISKSFSDNVLTNNPHIKCQLIDTLMIYFEKHIMNPYSPLSKQLDSYVFSDIAPKLLDMLIYNKECLSTGDLYDIILPQYRLCFLINHIVLNNKTRFQNAFDKLEDSETSKKIVSIVNSHFEYSFGEATQVLKKLSKHQKNLENEDDSDSDSEMNESPESLKRKCQFYCCSSIEFLFTIKKLTQNLGNTYMQIEIKDSFINIISSAMEALLGKNRKDFKVTNAKEIGFEPITYLIYLKDILINLSTQKEFTISLAKNERIDYLKYLDILLNILNMKGFVDINQESSINFLKFTLEKEVKIIKEKQKKLEELEDDIPDEFYDPIMATLIEEPIMLPSTKVIMDKTVITRHLINEQEDPFNRDELTMEMIEEFNKQPEIKTQLDEFKSKLDKFL